MFRVGLGLVSYGVSYGIQKLAGSIYLNLFLFNLVQIPSKGIAIWIQNRFVYAYFQYVLVSCLNPLYSVGFSYAHRYYKNGTAHCVL